MVYKQVYHNFPFISATLVLMRDNKVSDRHGSEYGAQFETKTYQPLKIQDAEEESCFLTQKVR